MKHIVRKLAMLLCVAIIANGAISCGNKAKKDAKETKQEVIQSQQKKRVKSEKEEHDELMQVLSEKMYSQGRSEGYLSGSKYESYREEEWYKFNLRNWKSVWINSNYTSEDIKVLEEAYRKGYHEGWEMGQSEK